MSTTYYIIAEPGTKIAELTKDDHGFSESFCTYEDAKETAIEYIGMQCIRSFEIIATCTDARNHVI